MAYLVALVVGSTVGVGTMLILDRAGWFDR
jgi:hypothetical protein